MATSASRILSATLFALPLLARPLAAQTGDQEHLAQNVFGQLQWQELGPVQTGGRIVDIAVHPFRPQTFWLAAASGGLWRTDNGGVTFTAQFQDAYSISIGDIAVAPSNGEVLWVGTGEGNNQRSSYWGNGVWRSIDGGKTFQHVGLEGTEHIGRIVVHPENADIAYVAALGALYKSNDERGLYKTTDGGRTWQRLQHLGPDVGFVDVVLHPQDPDIVFAASYERRRRAWHFEEGGEGSRLWKSTDAGATWTKLEKGLPAGKLGRIGIEPFLRNGDVLYATIENLNARTAAPAAAANPTDDDRSGDGDDGSAELPADLPAEVLADGVEATRRTMKAQEAQDPQRRPRRNTIGGEVYRSDDGGASWRKTNRAEDDVGGSPGYYYGQIRVDPNDENTLYVLSVPVHRSTDGGKTWTPRRGQRGGTFAESLHVDHHALWIDPNDSKHCLLGNDGGVAETFDAGAHWDHLTHLPVLQFYTVSADLAVPYRVYGGLQDNGSVGFPIHGKTSAGIQPFDAYRVGGGDGFYVCIDSEDPNTVYAESQFGGMTRVDLVTGASTSIRPRAQKGEQPLRFNWNTPIVLSPHAPRTVYAGSQFVHRSRDRGAHWQTISPDLSTNDADKKRGNVPHCTITTIAESPRREGLLWVGTDDGRVWCTKDGGGRWTDLTDRFPAAVQGLWVSRVEASPHRAETAFVAFTGYREDRREPFVFRTDDAGETWLAIAHDLPMEPVNVVRQHPRNEHVLLVGTEMGAYASIDDGAHWFRLGGNLPRVAVHDLIVHGREHHVLVGTHGRGIWALDAALLERFDAQRAQQAIVVAPASDGVLLDRSFSGGYTGARGWSAPNPFVTPAFHYVLAQDSEAAVEIEVVDVTGSVVWKKAGPKQAGYHRVAWENERRGPFGGGGGRGGAASSGPRPGTFAVRIKRGSETVTETFTVHDRRTRSSLLGAWPEDDEAEVGASRR